jgi:hypothetical protein
MDKICNQFCLKDAVRDKNYLVSVKCVCCDEVCHLPGKNPHEVRTLIKFLTHFKKVHEKNGCNKTMLPAPDWAITGE